MEHPLSPIVPPVSETQLEVVRQAPAAILPANEAASAVYDYSPAEEAPSGGLVEYWRILRRRKGRLIIIMFAGALAGILISLPQQPVYQARASVEIQDLNQDFLNMKQVNPVSEGSTYNALNDIQSQIRILQSENLLDRVVTRLNPESFAPSTPSLWSWVRSELHLPSPQQGHQKERMLDEVRRGLKIRAAGQTRVVEISSDSSNPKLAADIANTLASEFIDGTMEARWKMSQHTGEWLTRQLDEMRGKLRESEDALQSYARKSGLMFVSQETNVSEEKLAQLQKQLSDAQADRVVKQSRLEIANTSPPEALPDILNDASLRGNEDKLTDLKRQRSELSTTYMPDHSKLKKLEAQIQIMDGVLQKQRSAILRRIRNDYDESIGREKLIAVAYTAQTRLVSEQSGKSIQYGILKREVESNRQLYEAMLQRVKESRVASALRASNIRVLDVAKPPLHPYKPSLPLNAALGVLSGLVFGAIFIIVRERANRRLEEPGDASFYLNQCELGVIPAVTAGRKQFYYVKRKKQHEAGESMQRVIGVKAPDRSFDLTVWKNRSSITAESFRATVTSIMFTEANNERPRVLVLTSAGPAEGKTLLASNLGIALAETRQRILVIDADLRRPTLHDLFQVSNEQGLSTLLQQSSIADADLDAIILPTEVPGLSILPSGPSSSRSTNLLYSPRTAELLERLRARFDMILIDTPPMLHMPDARVLGRMSDAVVFVVRAGQTTRDAAQAAIQRLTGDHIRILGTILNDWNPKFSPNGYYGYHGAYYKRYSHYCSNLKSA